MRGDDDSHDQQNTSHRPIHPVDCVGNVRGDICDGHVEDSCKTTQAGKSCTFVSNLVKSKAVETNSRSPMIRLQFNDQKTSAH
ncbi:hypothetical protein KCU88_g387, partial [Aureobasidium melanogenum]